MPIVIPLRELKSVHGDFLGNSYVVPIEDSGNVARSRDPGWRRATC